MPLKFYKPHIKGFLVHNTTITRTTQPHTRMENDIKKDNSLLPLCRQDAKKEKRAK
jgi:hypothetical protein